MVTKQVLFANNAQTTLAGDITSSATTANLASGAGALFPNPSTNQCFFLTFVDAATGNVNEIVQVTNMTGDTITTMIRGQEGTSAKPWLAGDTAAQYVTAGDLQNFAQPRDVQTQTGNYGVDSGTANAMVIALSVVPSGLSALVGTDVRVTKNGADNTGGVTLAVNGLAATAVVDLAGNALTAGDLPGGCTFTVIYDGTHFVLQSSVPSNAVTGRVILTSNEDFYVATTGNNSNDGLTVGTPWLTLQHAWNVLQQDYDLAGFTATIHVANGSYAAGVVANGPPPPGFVTGGIVFTGGAGAVVNPAGPAFQANYGAQFTLDGGITAESSGSNGIEARREGIIVINNVTCGGVASSGAQIRASDGGLVVVNGSYAISGGGGWHYEAVRNGRINASVGSTVVTVGGTPAYSQQFAGSNDLGMIYVDSSSVSFSGSATGTRYQAQVNSIIETNGGGATYFPGSSAGSVATGGQYV